MTREEAQKLAQEKMVLVVSALQEAMALAEEHKFTLNFYGAGNINYDLPHEMPYDHWYFPKGITLQQIVDDQGMPWHGIWEGFFEENYGQWVSSSKIGDC